MQDHAYVVREGDVSVRMLGAMADITRRRRAEDERSRLYRDAQEAIHLRDEFLSMASHELRTPVTTVQLHLQELLVARVDPMRLEQVLLNLLSNAARYGRGLPIDVTLAEEGGRVQLTVQDRGIGIAPEDQRRIFERFERAVSERHYGGLGLGLWISQRIAMSLGGTIRVRSAPGQGATFVLELPRFPVGASLQAQAAQPVHS